jgi:DNA-binding response OmpR family regulator
MMPSEELRTDGDGDLTEGPGADEEYERPTVDEFGILRRAGSLVILPPSEQALAQILITDFGTVVSDEILEQHVVSESNSRGRLRRNASRLRKRVAPLGLTVTCIRNVGYMMHHDQREE